MKKTLLVTAILLASTAAYAESPKTNDPKELKKIIAQQEKQIKQLEAAAAENAEPASGNERPETDSNTNLLVKNKFQYNKE